MVAGVAHEVNNPLNFSVGGAAKLKSELRTVAEALERLHANGELRAARGACVTAARALELIEAGNARIGAIVDNLQAYVRMGRVAPELVSLNDEIERTLALAEPELEAQGVRVEKRLGELPRYPCVDGEIAQVLMNLVENARQAMPEGGKLEVSSSADADSILITFKDSGHGVPPEHRDKIFEPFFTTRPPGQGTGLGLSISHEIVRRHAGQLRLEPSERGADFRISLPLPVEDRE